MRYIWTGKGCLALRGQMIPQGELLPEDVKLDDIKVHIDKGWIRKATKEEIAGTAPAEDSDDAPDLSKMKNKELVAMADKMEDDRETSLGDGVDDLRTKHLGSDDLFAKSGITKIKLIAYITALQAIDVDDDGGDD